MGWHWHFWNLLLAVTPAACITWYFGGVSRDLTVPWVNNNRGLTERIENLERANFGEAIDESPEADARRRQELMQAGSAAGELPASGIIVAPAGRNDDDDEYEYVDDDEHAAVVASLMDRVAALEAKLTAALAATTSAVATGTAVESGTAAASGTAVASGTAAQDAATVSAVASNTSSTPSGGEASTPAVDADEAAENGP